MPKQSNNVCKHCLTFIPSYTQSAIYQGEIVCIPCYDALIESHNESLPVLKSKYDNVQKPQHYHRYDMDTITFLKQGFPPDVYKGFCIGNVIKYTQRYELKNGQEDLDKAAFYQKELVEWVKKNHS